MKGNEEHATDHTHLQDTSEVIVHGERYGRLRAIAISSNKAFFDVSDKFERNPLLCGRWWCVKGEERNGKGV
jgi:hypothetical protein